MNSYINCTDDTDCMQGMACAMGDANALFDCLQASNTIDLTSALEKYTLQRVPEGNAITDLNFIRSQRKEFNFLFMATEAIRKLAGGKALFDYVMDPSIPYTEVLKQYQGWVNRGKKSNKYMY